MMDTVQVEVLQVRDLVKVYRGASEPAVNGLDFSVRQGEIFGLLGPNGAGKTTAISVICALTPPTRGQVTLGGHDVVRNPGAVRSCWVWHPRIWHFIPG